MFWLCIFSVTMKCVRSESVIDMTFNCRKYFFLKNTVTLTNLETFQCDAKCMESLLTIKIFPLEKTEASFIIKCDTEFVIQPSFGSLK